MEHTLYGLKGKVAIITGGSRGIGFETARAFLHEGARVVICGRKEENLQKAADALSGGDSLLTVQAHVGKDEDVERLFTQTIDRFGTCDILINNVGMNIPSPSCAETDPALFKKIIDTNLTGAFLCSRGAAVLMKEKKQGKIVSVTSIAARRAAPGMGIYGIAKAGIEMMTRVLAAELALYNIQVNAVAPGMVRTDFSRPFWSNDAIYKEVIRGIPMGRIAEPSDVVYPVLFLSSQGADFITGQTLAVDGGATAV